MRQGLSKKTQKQLRSILYKNGFGMKKLEPFALQTFVELGNSIAHRMIKKHMDRSLDLHPADAYVGVMGLIKQGHETVSLDYVMKKMAITHVLMRKFAHQQLIDEPTEQELIKQANHMLKHELPSFFTLRTAEKRASSLTKIYGMIRDLSTSRQKSRKGALQKQNEKGALRQILNKIVEPYLLYLMKVMQDHPTYSNIIRKKVPKECAEVRWKMINWAKTLGKIILELHRMSRYYKSELMGFLVFMTYIISRDLAVYYDSLKKHIERESNSYKKELEEVRINPETCLSLTDEPGFVELKGYIDEVNVIKEHIHHIFGNKELREWRGYFDKPDKYQLSYENQHEGIDFVLELAQKGKKYKKSSTSQTDNSFTSLVSDEMSFSSLVDISHEQRPTIFSLNLSQAKNDELFKNIQEEHTSFKVTKIKPAKQRMNFFKESMRK